MKKEPDTDAPSSVALSSHIFHRSMCLIEENSWERGSYLSDIFYLSILLEKFVIHDHLYVRMHTNIDENTAMDMELLDYDTDATTLISTRFARNEILAPLLDANAFTFFEPDVNICLDQCSEIIDEFSEFTGDEFFDPYIAYNIWAMRHAFASGLPFIPDKTEYASIAFKLLFEQQTYRFSILEKVLSGINEDLRRQVRRLVDAGAGAKIFLPSIPAIIFDRSDKRSDIGRRALELRDEFSALRTIFHSYETQIRDDSLSLGESLSALNELESAVEAAYPSSESSLVTQVTEWRDLVDFGKWVDGVSSSDAVGSLKFVLGKPIQLAANKLKTRKVFISIKVAQGLFSNRKLWHID